MYNGDLVSEACQKLNRAEPTGYRWLASWNKEGYKGLVPKFTGGPKLKLGEAEREELKIMLSEKDAWTLKEICKLIKEKFKVEYSESQVGRILKSWHMHHAKPYVKDKRRPDDAETILKKD